MAAALTEFSFPARNSGKKQAGVAWHAGLRRQRSGAAKNTVKPYFQCVADADGGHRKKEITTAQALHPGKPTYLLFPKSAV
ncbi:hypothetical protein [Achromobacter sp. DH1f]|uniref:hypothetical protein n=1 Tax=Achromobacter sp. DH1f TaxID=1397275 RepID=UPI0012FF3097|nr:hypothetical protein [Achromobacter sp. DH1f]